MRYIRNTCMQLNVILILKGRFTKITFSNIFGIINNPQLQASSLNINSLVSHSFIFSPVFFEYSSFATEAIWILKGLWGVTASVLKNTLNYFSVRFWFEKKLNS